MMKFKILLATVFVLLGGLALGKFVWDGANALGISDFGTYYYVTKGVFSARPEHPYVNFVPLYPFFYPPQSLLLFRFLLILPFAYAKLAWSVANCLFVVGFLYLILKIFGKSRPLSFLNISTLFLLAVLSFPLRFTVTDGQANLFLLFLVTWGFYFFQKKHDGLAGVVLGVATVLKISPFMLLFFFLLKRCWKIFLSGLVTIFGLTILAEIFVKRGISWYYLRYVVDNIADQGGLKSGFRDQSLRHLFLRLDILNRCSQILLEKLPASLSFVDVGLLASLASWSLVAAAVLLLAFVSRRKVTDRDGLDVILEYVLFYTVAVLGTGLVWYHQYAMLLLPFFVLLICLAKKGLLKYSYVLFPFALGSYLLTAVNWEGLGLWERLPGLWNFGMLGGALLGFLLILLLRIRLEDLSND